MRKQEQIESIPGVTVSYMANSVFGPGGTIATNKYTVYNGNGNRTIITRLIPATTYHIPVASPCSEPHGTGFFVTRENTGIIKRKDGCLIHGAGVMFGYI